MTNSENRMLYERQPNPLCPKAEELHKYIHLWSAILCQWNVELYQAIYDMAMYSKHAHSCKCGAIFSFNAFTEYINKYCDSDINKNLMNDYNAWLKSGPNRPPTETSRQNLYSCGMTVWLCVHAYSGYILTDEEYELTANILLSHCVNERLLARSKPMDSGVDVEARQLPLETIFHCIVTNRKLALEGLSGICMRPEVAKILVFHSLGYL